MKKKKYILLFFLLLCINVGCVYADSVGLTYAVDNSGNTVTRINNGVTGDPVFKLALQVGDTTIPGYCIDYGANLQGGVVYRDEKPIADHFYQGLLNQTSADAIAKKVNAYTALGYGHYGRNTENYYLATQKLIWEILSGSNFYQSDYYYDRFKVRTTLINFVFTSDVSAEETEIKNAWENYYVTPSICGNKDKLELGVGETKTYTDTNNVLSLYEVYCSDGLSCTKDGNNLMVTSNNSTQNQVVKLYKNGTSGCQPSGECTTVTPAYAYRPTAKSQGVIFNVGYLEDVSCQIGVDSITQVQTSGMKTVYLMMIAGLSLAISYILFFNKKKTNEIST